MNALFNTAFRQSNTIRKELATLSESPETCTPAVQGQTNASLTSFVRTIDEYANLTKQEIVPEKQEKALGRIKNFRAELSEYRAELDRLKRQGDDTQAAQSRTELLGRRPHHASSDATPENPYANNNASSAGVFKSSGSSALGAGPNEYARENHAFREQSFMSSTNASLDEFLDRGRAVLGDLSQQKEMLKGTQRRLYSVANTLGISGDTIRMIERRAKQDKWIFYAGVITFIGFVWLVLHYLR